MFEESASNPSIWASMNSWFTPTVLFVLLNLMIGTIFFSSSLSNTDQQQEEKEKQEQAGSHQYDPQQPKLARSPSVLQRLKSINLYNFRSQESISSLFKQNLDSDTHHSSQQANQVQQTIESHTHYIFEETHQHETVINDTQFDFEQTHEAVTPKSQTHFDFEQTHGAKSPKMQTPYVPEETHGDEEEDGDPQSLDEVYSQMAQVTGRHVSRTTSDTNPASGEVPAKLSQKMRKSATMKSVFRHFEERDIVEDRRPATVRERGAKATEDDDEVDAKADDFISKFKQQLKLQRLDSIIRYKEVIGRGSAK